MSWFSRKKAAIDTEGIDLPVADYYDLSFEVGIEAETDEQSLQRGIFALDGYAEVHGLEETREKEFYCGLCGWSPISTFPHDH